MIRLHNDRLDILRKYLLDCKICPDLYEEILDHIACETEERMWDGDTFENILKLVKLETEGLVLSDLSSDLKEILESEKSLIDIVFEGRNKQYGAYELRKGYDSTIQRSAILGVLLFLFMISLPNLYARFIPESDPNEIGFEIELNNVNIRPFIEENVPPKMRTAQSDNSTSNGLETQVGSKKDEFMNYNHNSKSNLPRDFQLPSDLFFNEQLLLVEEGKGIFDLLDQKPEFMGGMSELLNYISFQIDYPATAVRNSVQGRVMIGFTIDTDGAVQDVDVIKGIGHGCDEEAKRVISNMPRWKPGRQGGELISTRYLIPVVFEIKKL